MKEQKLAEGTGGREWTASDNENKALEVWCPSKAFCFLRSCPT